MNITVREYTSEDRSVLEICIESLQKHIVEIDPLKRQIVSAGYGKIYTEGLLKAISEKDGKIYFAEVDGKVVGVIAGTLAKQFPHGGTLEAIPSSPAWIRELYVDPAVRGKGVGRSLIQKLEEYFKSKGCDVVLVGVFAPNGEAQSFYESQGYIDREITMLKKL